MNLEELAARVTAMPPLVTADAPIPPPPRDADVEPIDVFMQRTFRPEGADGVTRFQAVGRVAGHFAKQVAEGRMSLADAGQALLEWKRAHIEGEYEDEKALIALGDFIKADVKRIQPKPVENVSGPAPPDGGASELPPNAIKITADEAQFADTVFMRIRDLMPDSVFRRGGQLVRVEQLIERAGDTESVVKIVPLDDAALSYMLNYAGAAFVGYDARAGKWVQKRPGPALQRVLRLTEFSKLPELRGVQRGPSLHRDEPGFDPVSGLYLWFNKCDFPAIPERPTLDDARAAIERLATPFRKFPFADGDALIEGSAPSVSRSVVLSAILSGVVRGELRTCPLHGFDAKSDRTGKTLCIDTVAAIVNGYGTSTMTWKGNEEDEKTLVTKLRAGETAVHIENVNMILDSADLATILTTQVYAPRLLSTHTALHLPTNVLFCVSANDLRMSSELAGRTIVATMNADCEHPQHRKFDFHPVDEAKRNRGRLYMDALTVLRAYEAAGRPKAGGFSHLGMFEQWSDLVRGALIWAGQPDPLESQPGGDKGDLKRQGDADVLECIAGAFGVGVRFSSDDLTADFPSGPVLQLRQRVVDRLNLKEWDRVRGRNYMARLVGKVREGLVLRSAEDRTGAKRLRWWWLERKGE